MAIGRPLIACCAAIAVAIPLAVHAQALLPPGSDHTKVLVYGGRFDKGDYYLSADEANVQRRAAGIIERALAGLVHDAIWHVTSVDEFRQHEDRAFPGAPARAGLMSCSYTVELELDHESQLFRDVMARNEAQQQRTQRLAEQAQAAAQRGDVAALQQLQRQMPIVTAPGLTVHVDTNPRDVSRYLRTDTTRLTVPGADYAFLDTPDDPGQPTVTTIGIGHIVKNTVGGGSAIELKPSRLWRTQHFVELTLQGDRDLAARALDKVDVAALRAILTD